MTANSVSGDRAEYAGEKDAGAPAADAVSTGLDFEALDQKIIKNGEVSLTVKSDSEAESQIRNLVVKYRGFVQNTNSYRNERQNRTDMDVRIPADSFDSFLGDLRDVGEITHSRVYTTDVTEEYIDLAARQKTLSLQEQRLQDMIGKAKDVDELLKVENELSRVRGEIERITGRLKYLDNRLSYSTVSIRLSTKYIPSEAEVEDFGAQVLFSLREGWTAFCNLILFFIRAAAWFLPFAVLIIPAGYFLLKRYRSKKRPS